MSIRGPEGSSFGLLGAMSQLAAERGENERLHKKKAEERRPDKVSYRDLIKGIESTQAVNEVSKTNKANVQLSGEEEQTQNPDGKMLATSAAEDELPEVSQEKLADLIAQQNAQTVGTRSRVAALYAEAKDLEVDAEGLFRSKAKPTDSTEK